MDIRQDRRYTKEHEWVRVEGDIAFIGITDHAQEALGDIVFVELPPEGKTLASGDVLAVLESVKAASSVFSAVSGRVAEVNKALEDQPELLNRAPYEEYIAQLSPFDATQLMDLMDADAYATWAAGQ